MVRDENLRFMKNRDVYNPDYFNFTLSLASVNAVRGRPPLLHLLASLLMCLLLSQRIITVNVTPSLSRPQTKLKHPSYQAMATGSLQLAVQFLLHTYLRTKKKLR